MTIGSHWDTCWKDSSEHWECAVYRAEQLELGLLNNQYHIEQLEKQVERLEALAKEKP